MDSFVLNFDENFDDLPKQFNNEIIQQNDIVIIRSSVGSMEVIG